MARFISKNKKRNMRDMLFKAFQMYDDDDGGTIGLDNLQSVRNDLGYDYGDDALRLMLKFGDPAPNERYGGQEVDFEQFMVIMEKAGLYKPEGSL